jgi:hypothetical protein
MDAAQDNEWYDEYREKFRKLFPMTTRPSTTSRRVTRVVEEDPRRCLVLAGPTGAGETVALIAGFRRLAV